jgi:23S rRNA (adenine2503-C2)-methyltransferase
VNVAARPDIKALDRAGLERALADLGEPAWRASQLVRWLYGRQVSSFEEMTDLPQALRERLADLYELSSPAVVERRTSELDGTRKYLLEFADGVRIECVGLPSGDRLTVCFSSQAGCAMGCTFCATGQEGLTRNLKPGEIVDQIGIVGGDFGLRVSNAVAMGQGEPFANYDAVLAALRFANSKEGLGIGARHLTVSTCGVVPGISRFASEPEQFTLAVSLHSAVQSTRDSLMPAMRGYPLDALRTALQGYSATGRRPTLEYALIEGVNDTDAELGALMAFCADLGCHVNLIPINPVAGSETTRPSADAAPRFRRALMARGIEASVRVERGPDIEAACGQLRRSRA